MKQKIRPRIKIKQVREDLKNYRKISNRAFKEILETRFNMDLSLSQVNYYRNNLETKDTRKQRTKRRTKDKLNRLNDFFNKFGYFGVKNLYQFVKKVYEWHNKDIQEFDFRALDNNLTYRETKGEAIKKLKKRGLITPKLKIDLEIEVGK